MRYEKQIVVIGLLGPTLDQGTGAHRWERWRPTLSVCQHEDLLVHRFELLFQKRFTSLATDIAKDIRQVSPETGVRPYVVEMADAWDFQAVYGALHDWARAYPFDPDHEEYLVHITTGTHVAQICLFLLTEARYLPGKLLQTSPPARGKDGPGSFAVIDLDLSRYDRIASRFRQETTDDVSFLKSGIATRNAAFNALIERIERVAIRSRDPILLMGPTGAGKSRLARRIYELRKARCQVTGTLIEVNCATIRGDAAMSTLFGHKKGAFTGAVHDRDGLLRAADGGTLFLDEIGELGADEQAMLLRAIEEKCFLPLGSDKEVRSDFQLICGTNRDLQALARTGEFRADLRARIDLWTFRLPGLAERPEDIEPNLQYELDRYAERTGSRITFNKEARETFLAFACSSEARWAGNFRDLNGAVTRMATLASGGRIAVEDVKAEIVHLRTAGAHTEAPGGDDDVLVDLLGSDRVAKLDHFDRVQFAEVVRVCCATDSLSEAGRALFAESRKAKASPNDADRLRKYLARFGVAWKQLKLNAPVR